MARRYSAPPSITGRYRATGCACLPIRRLGGRRSAPYLTVRKFVQMATPPEEDDSRLCVGIKDRGEKWLCVEIFGAKRASCWRCLLFALDLLGRLGPRMRTASSARARGAFAAARRPVTCKSRGRTRCASSVCAISSSGACCLSGPVRSGPVRQAATGASGAACTPMAGCLCLYVRRPADMYATRCRMLISHSV